MERRAFRISGFLMVVLLLLVAAVATVLAFVMTSGGAIGAVLGVAAGVIAVLATGFLVVNPNDAQVIRLVNAGSLY